jgi:hypothetical protein
MAPLNKMVPRKDGTEDDICLNQTEHTVRKRVVIKHFLGIEDRWQQALCFRPCRTEAGDFVDAGTPRRRLMVPVVESEKVRKYPYL